MDPRLEFQRLQVLRSLHLLDGSTVLELEELCKQVQERFEVEMVLVTIIDRERQIVKARAGTDFEGSSRPDAFCDYLIRSDDVLVVRDARRDPRFASNPLVTGAPFIRFYAGAPLIYMQDVRLGGLCLLDTTPRDFTAVDQVELAGMADEVMHFILEHEMERLGGALKQ